MRKPIYKSRPVEPNPAKFGGERLNDFIILSEAFSNSYLIETPAGNIQLNTGMGLEAPVIDANFKKFSDQNTQHIILTQGHVDHVGGVAYFRRQYPEVQVIAHQESQEHQNYEQRITEFRNRRSAFAFEQKFADIFQYYQENGYTDFEPQDQPTPDILVGDKHQFTLGGLEVEVIALAGAETNDSLIVWLPQHKICFTGNLFGCPFGHFPNLFTIRGDRYRDPLVVANAVKTVQELEPETIMYGHHAPIYGKALIAEELGALHGAIMYVHDAVVAGMNAGKQVHELQAEIHLPPEFEVGQGYGQVSWGVRAIWEYYVGWFYHRSTTELYHVPQQAIHADLVEMAGGVDAVLAKAQEKAAQGAREAAIHFLDLLASAGIESPQARQLYVDIHESLLAEADNFWLENWLSYQIRQNSK